MAERAGRGTSTSRFGAGRRESHDASDFYARFRAPEVSDDDTVHGPVDLAEPLRVGDSRDLAFLPDNSVALVVTSPPYFAGKQYEEEMGQGHIPGSYVEFLEMLRDVFAECTRVLEPGGRIAVNIANLGRKPYRSLSADVVHILQDDLGLLLRGEVIWSKAEGASGSCAWGSFRSAVNPVLRDITERVVIASKGRFDRAHTPAQRSEAGLPFENTLTNDEFMEATLDVWRLAPESARRVQHPAPFPIELPLRLIELFTFKGDLVVDPFVGSGTTAVAAARAGRRYAGSDTDATYVAIARERVATEEARLAAGAAGADGPVDVNALASREGKGAKDIAAAALTRAGFTVADKPRKVAGVDIVEATDAKGREWYFDVSGGFTSSKSGLVRSDTLWRSLGRVSVLRARATWPVVLLTSHLPAHRSAGDSAIRALGPSGVFDAVEMLDPVGLQRLAAYAKGARRKPLPGFWTETELGGA